MTIRIRCPKCRQPYQLTDAAAGKMLRCKNTDCGTVIRIPRPKPATSPPDDDFLSSLSDAVDDRDDIDLPELPRPSRKKSAGRQKQQIERKEKRRPRKKGSDSGSFEFWLPRIIVVSIVLGLDLIIVVALLL